MLVLWKSATDKAFTLVEMMIAIVIISIMSAIAYPYYLTTVHEASQRRAYNDFKTIGNAAINYHLNYQKWPQNINDLCPMYLEKNMTDPWGNNYTIMTLPKTVERPVGSGNNITINCFYVFTTSRRFLYPNDDTTFHTTSEIGPSWQLVETE
ncbi:MAG: prepilin-type N-terminal cleavage/methylation domain-containing protein [Candidatus Wallbacteria bacterium]|nr:prepilin-type N-terminal cleavage/methylation domain-containing protein [Candidatus Wallbacteria bacterium]